MPRTEQIFPDIEPACECIKTREGTAFSIHGYRNFTRFFDVYTTNPLYGPNEICSAKNLPLPYEQYALDGGVDFDRLAVMVLMTAKLNEQSDDDNRFWWTVEAVYSTDTPQEGIPAQTNMGYDPVGSQNNPWDEPPLKKWESETIQRALPNDRNGLPFLNSAKQPFSPPPTFEQSRRILVLTRNQQTFDIATVSEYDWAVNSDIFMGFNPGTVQCFPITAEEMMRGNLRYHKVFYRLRFGTEIWVPAEDGGVGGAFEIESFQPRILDAGMCKLQKTILAPGLDFPVPILRFGFPISQPVLLNGEGEELNPITENPHYIDFTVWKSMPFGPILTTGIG